MPRPLAKTNEFAPLPSRPALPAAPSVAPFRENGAEWAESPARLLHERLIATFSPPAPAVADEVLSPRAKLAIVVGSSAALWVVIALAVAAIL